MFSYDQLARMRETQDLAMPELVTIKRKALSDDGFGGVTHGTQTTVETDVPARITQAQALDMGGQAGRNLMIEKWTVRVPTGTDLREEDLVVWGSITLRIEDVKPRSYQTAVTATAEVVK